MHEAAKVNKKKVQTYARNIFLHENYYARRCFVLLVKMFVLCIVTAVRKHQWRIVTAVRKHQWRISCQISSFIKHAFSLVSLGDACYLARVYGAVHELCLGAESSLRSPIKSITNCIVRVPPFSIDGSMSFIWLRFSSSEYIGEPVYEMYTVRAIHYSVRVCVRACRQLRAALI
jgi:hypothetical protein